MNKDRLKRGVILAFVVAALAFAAWDAYLLRGPLRNQFTSAASRLDAERQTYLEKEGPEHRGPKFSDLATTMEDARRGGKAFSQPEIVAQLGKPDYVLTWPQLQQWFYVFDNFAKKDGCVEVNIDANGNLREISFDVMSQGILDYIKSNNASTKPGG